ncbi:hypothetical protein D3C72_1065070 [compost metagenome]
MAAAHTTWPLAGGVSTTTLAMSITPPPMGTSLRVTGVSTDWPGVVLAESSVARIPGPTMTVTVVSSHTVELGVARQTS